MATTPEDVLQFWLQDVGEAGWYISDKALDDRIRAGFLDTWTDLSKHRLEHWRTTARGTLAYLIVADQFSRNMFRGDPRSFATDAMARIAASAAIKRGWDQVIAAPERQFMFMPFMHSECLADQDHAVCLMQDAMPNKGGGNLLHARAHREIIRRFSRFPFRNAALGRTSSPDEARFITSGAYGAMVKELEAALEPA